MTRNSRFGTDAPAASGGEQRAATAHTTHTAHFYSSDEVLLAEVAQRLAATLAAGGAAIVIATAPHRRSLEQQLRMRGLEPWRLADQGRWRALEVAETLDQFVVEGWPSEKRFVPLIRGIIDEMTAAVAQGMRTAEPPVAVFGEMGAHLWGQGQTAAALRLEQLWNRLGRGRRFHMFCGWPLFYFSRDTDAVDVQRICSQHTHVFPSPAVDPTREEEFRRFGILWQLKAQALLQRSSHIARQIFGLYQEVPAPQWTSIAEAVNDVLAIYHTRCRNNRISIAIRIRSGLKIRTVPGEFKQIVSNLISNAIEACPPDRSIYMRAWQAHHAVTGKQGIRLAVSHRDIDIPASLRRTVSPYRPPSPAGAHVNPGSRLTMEILKNLLDRKGGSLQCRVRSGLASQPELSSQAVRMVFLPVETSASTEEDRRIASHPGTAVA